MWDLVCLVIPFHLIQMLRCKRAISNDRGSITHSALSSKPEVGVTRSVFINFRNRGFWAYDVPSSVFLKFLIDAANDRLESDPSQWLVDAIQNWRVTAVIPDLSHYAEDDWSQPQIESVTELCKRAVSSIRSHGDILAQEIESWPFVDNYRIFTRRHNPVPCEPVARLGEAFIALLDNSLPKPPDRHWWFFTLDEAPDVIAMKEDF